MGGDRKGRGAGDSDPPPSDRVLDSRPRGRGLELNPRHCVVSLSKNINPSLVLVQSRKTRPFITKRLLMGRKESNLITSCHLFPRRKPGTNLPREAIRPPHTPRPALSGSDDGIIFLFSFLHVAGF